MRRILQQSSLGFVSLSSSSHLHETKERLSFWRFSLIYSPLNKPPYVAKQVCNNRAILSCFKSVLTTYFALYGFSKTVLRSSKMPLAFILFFCKRLLVSVARSLHLSLNHLCTTSNLRPGPEGSRTAASCRC